MNKLEKCQFIKTEPIVEFFGALSAELTNTELRKELLIEAPFFSRTFASYSDFMTALHDVDDDMLKTILNGTYDDVEKYKLGRDRRLKNTKSLILAITLALGLTGIGYKTIPKIYFMTNKEQQELFSILDKPESSRTPEEVYKMEQAVKPYGQE